MKHFLPAPGFPGIASLMLLAGCFDDSCGPQLMEVSVHAQLAVAWTPENRTLAREVLETHGYTIVEDGPGYVQARRYNETALLQPSGNATFLAFDIEVFSRELDFDEAKALGESYRNWTLERFDPLLAGLQSDTGWKTLEPGRYSPSFVIC